jgi:hypothetical protein
MEACIWHKKLHAEPSFEEILLAGFGCPKEYTFSDGEVCRPCNSRCAHLDQAVLDAFDFLAFFRGVPRRGGKPPQVVNRGNVLCRWTPQGPAVFINMEKHAITTPYGDRVAPYRGKPRDIEAVVQQLGGGQGEVSWGTLLGEDPKFVRGVHKMAFELFALHLGARAVLDARYDAVRRFVLEGKGVRHILVGMGGGPWPSPFLVPTAIDCGDTRYAMLFGILEVSFWVDLTPTQEVLPAFMRRVERESGTHGWSYLPLKPAPVWRMAG